MQGWGEVWTSECCVFGGRWWGILLSWHWLGAVLLTALESRTIILNRMRAATGSQWRSRRRGVTLENLGILKTRQRFSCRGWGCWGCRIICRHGLEVHCTRWRRHCDVLDSGWQVHVRTVYPQDEEEFSFMKVELEVMRSCPSGDAHCKWVSEDGRTERNSWMSSA